MSFMHIIKEKSSLLHTASEQTGYIKKIVDGKATIEGYGEYILNLMEMYKSIENVLEKNKDNDIIKPFVTPELYRSEYIKKDIDFLLGDKLNSIKILSSTEACVDRIECIGKKKPELIIAHAYTRFLADLFGGRTFFSLLSSKYGIKNEGLNYYTFDKLGDMKEYIMEYHNKLNSANIDNSLKSDLINEISNSYIYNLAISNELDVKLNK